MSASIPPQIIAEGDQIMARADGRLTEFVDRFREHTDRHGGDTLCPFAEAVITSAACRDIPEMFAAAVTRLARQQPADPTAMS